VHYEYAITKRSDIYTKKQAVKSVRPQNAWVKKDVKSKVVPRNSFDNS